MPKQFKSVVDLIKGVSGDSAFKEKALKKILGNKLSKFLFALRCKNGLTQKELAQKIGCTQGSISKVESADDDELSVKDLRNYAKALGFELEIGFRTKNTRYVDMVKFHAFQMQRYLHLMAEVADGDDAIEDGVKKFYREAQHNLDVIISKSFEKLEKSKVNKIDRAHGSDVHITGPVSAEMAGV